MGSASPCLDAREQLGSVMGKKRKTPSMTLTLSAFLKGLQDNPSMIYILPSQPLQAHPAFFIFGACQPLCKVTDSRRLEKPSKIIWSNHTTNITHMSLSTRSNPNGASFWAPIPNNSSPALVRQRKASAACQRDIFNPTLKVTCTAEDFRLCFFLCVCLVHCNFLS